MQLKIAFLFFVLAFVRGEQELEVEEDECGAEKAGECIANLLLAVLSDESEEEVCRALKETSQCLHETADECFGDNKDPEIEDSLRELRQIVTTNCPQAAFVRGEQELEVKEDGCGDEKAGECIANLLLSVLSDQSEEEVCRVLKETSQCLHETADECFGDNKDPELEDSLLELRQIVTTNCPRADDDVPDDVKKCVSGLEDELMECVSDGIEQTLDNIIQLSSEQELDENEIKCSMYDSISSCVVKKVEDGCGKEAGSIALAEMNDAPEEIRENCHLSTARDALKGLMYDIAKRRRK